MTNSRSRASRSEPADAVVVSSEDGAVSYRLQSMRLGLCVQRERRYGRANARLVHTVVFRDNECFLRWCDADSVRFDYPLVSSVIRRKGGAMLASDG